MAIHVCTAVNPMFDSIDPGISFTYVPA
jgi:hypothetical protein